MPNKLQDMSGLKHAKGLSTLNEGLRSLINAIFENTQTIGIFGVDKPVQYFYNHGYDKDPSTNGGHLPGNITVLIYYQPANQEEYKKWQVIDKEGFLSGRRRLAVRIEAGGYPSNDNVFAFYLTNHPQAHNGIKNNNYGVFTPIDLKR